MPLEKELRKQSLSVVYTARPKRKTLREWTYFRRKNVHSFGNIEAAAYYEAFITYGDDENDRTRFDFDHYFNDI